MRTFGQFFEDAMAECQEPWERRAALLGRLPGAVLEQFPSMDRLEHLLARGALSIEDLQIVNSRDGFVSGRYLVDTAGRFGLAKLHAQLRAGNSVVFYRLGRMLDTVFDASADIARKTGHQVECNGYWSPPLSQGLPVHIDAHDVFVLQLRGAKAWAVHPMAVVFPSPRQAGPLKLSSAPELECTLEPGDLLYVPAGCPHFAVCTPDTESFHLTFGVHKRTVLDAAIDALRMVAETDERWRWPLQPHGSRTVVAMENLLAEAFRDVEFRSAALRSGHPAGSEEGE